MWVKESSWETVHMEIAHILKTLWRLRLMVVIVALIAVVAAYATAFKLSFPPTFEARSIEYGSATTQVLIDGRQSPLVDLAQEVDPLATRAQVFTRLVMSDPAQAAIAKEAGLPPGSFVVAAETSTEGSTQASTEPGAEERSAQIAGESVRKRILFTAEPELPVISIYSQAPTGAEATKLADAGARGLMAYLGTLQEDARKVPEASLVEYSQLGPAQGRLVNPGASFALAAMAFLGILLVGCIGLVLLFNLVLSMRQPAPGSRVLAPVPQPGEAPQAVHPRAGEAGDPVTRRTGAR